VVAPDEKDCDITSIDTLSAFIDSVQPTVIINCAAYNAVDLAEQQSETAVLINTTAVREYCGVVCGQEDLYGALQFGLCVRRCERGSVYRTSMFRIRSMHTAGRNAAEKKPYSLPEQNHLVLRTSWVFGNGAQNFIHKMLQWSQKNPILKLTADEVSVPTSTIDLVEITLHSLEQGLTGLFHLTNSDYASRYEWGRYVARKLSLPSTIIPVPMSMFPSPAQRPLFSAMSNESLQKALGISIDKRIGVMQWIDSSLNIPNKNDDFLHGQRTFPFEEVDYFFILVSIFNERYSSTERLWVILAQCFSSRHPSTPNGIPSGLVRQSACRFFEFFLGV
jgi:dTDP-4-dehydrorhamnose reductase